MGFDLSYGLQPILNTIYLYETPICTETFQELLYLFKVYNNINTCRNLNSSKAFIYQSILIRILMIVLRMGL